MTQMGGDYPLCSQHTGNQFWNKTFVYWSDFCFKTKPSSNLEISQSCLWYNRRISKYPLYYPAWHRRGIELVGDIIKSEGNVLSHEELNRKYNFQCNIIEYQRIKLLVKTFVTTYRDGNIFPYQRPIWSIYLQNLSKSKKGSKDFYNIYMSAESEEPSGEAVWTEKLNLRREYV